MQAEMASGAEPGPLAPGARITPLDQAASDSSQLQDLASPRAQAARGRGRQPRRLRRSGTSYDGLLTDASQRKGFELLLLGLAAWRKPLAATRAKKQWPDF